MANASQFFGFLTKHAQHGMAGLAGAGYRRAIEIEKSDAEARALSARAAGLAAKSSQLNAFTKARELAENVRRYDEGKEARDLLLTKTRQDITLDKNKDIRETHKTIADIAYKRGDLAIKEGGLALEERRVELEETFRPFETYAQMMGAQAAMDRNDIAKQKAISDAKRQRSVNVHGADFKNLIVRALSSGLGKTVQETEEGMQTDIEISRAHDKVLSEVERISAMAAESGIDVKHDMVQITHSAAAGVLTGQGNMSPGIFFADKMSHDPGWLDRYQPSYRWEAELLNMAKASARGELPVGKLQNELAFLFSHDQLKYVAMGSPLATGLQVKLRVGLEDEQYIGMVGSRNWNPETPPSVWGGLSNMSPADRLKNVPKEPPPQALNTNAAEWYPEYGVPTTIR